MTNKIALIATSERTTRLTLPADLAVSAVLAVIVGCAAPVTIDDVESDLRSSPTLRIVGPAVGSHTALWFDLELAATPSDIPAWCSVDGGELAPCVSGKELRVAATGSHDLRVILGSPRRPIATATTTFTAFETPQMLITLNPVDGARVGSAGEAVTTVVGPFPNVSIACAVNQVAVDCDQIAWSGLADGAPVVVDATATDLDTGVTGRTARRTAVVDAQAPTITISSPNDGAVYGPGDLPAFEFSCAENGAPCEGMTYSCTISAGSALLTGSCVPGESETLAFDRLLSGPVCITVTAIDSVGNQGANTVCVSLDATGPQNLAVTQLPSGSLCATAKADEEITFTATDAGPYEWTAVTFLCWLDFPLGEPLACTQTGPNSASFSWQSLAEGTHMLQVIAVDRFGNFGFNPPEQSPGMSVWISVNADGSVRLSPIDDGCL